MDRRSSWITKDIYDKKHQDYQDQIQTLEIELFEHKKADYDYQTTVATVISVTRRAKNIFENSSDIAGKRAFLSYLLQNPTVNEKKLYFTIASPFNLVLKLADHPTLLDMVRDIGTFWKTNKEHIWLPNIKQGFFGITRPTSEELAAVK